MYVCTVHKAGREAPLILGLCVPVDHRYHISSGQKVSGVLQWLALVQLLHAHS